MNDQCLIANIPGVPHLNHRANHGRLWTPSVQAHYYGDSIAALSPTDVLRVASHNYATTEHAKWPVLGNLNSAQASHVMNQKEPLSHTHIYSIGNPYYMGP